MSQICFTERWNSFPARNTERGDKLPSHTLKEQSVTEQMTCLLTRNLKLSHCHLLYLLWNKSDVTQNSCSHTSGHIVQYYIEISNTGQFSNMNQICRSDNTTLTMIDQACGLTVSTEQCWVWFQFASLLRFPPIRLCWGLRCISISLNYVCLPPLLWLAIFFPECWGAGKCVAMTMRNCELLCQCLRLSSIQSSW